MTQAKRAPTPEAVHQQLAELFNAGDLDALMALYEPDAVLVPEPGKRVQGTADLRAALAGFLALRPTNTVVDTVSVLVAGDLALTRSDWSLRGTVPGDGSVLDLHHRGVEIMKRGADGAWRFLIDDPYAGD